ncbi:MAG TPA: hypothetical protein VHC49_15350 [Mycobacteriales bacterium]|nr:hypothetical protein [Mycobacteriales bacterium]
MFSGFSADSDLDLVLIWDRDDLPSAQERPAHALCDADFAPRQNDGPAYALDNLMVGGWAVDVASYTRACFEGWFAAVESSGGWRPNAWPLPLHAVAGFIYGQPLADPHGTGETIRTTRRVPPNSLATGALDCLGRDLPVYAADLASAARRDDAWLFHALASPLIKNAYVAWFASEGYYLPFPKHLNRWVERFGLDQRQLQLEKEIWSAPTLTRRRDAIIRFAENVLGT